MEFPKTRNLGNPHIGLFARASDKLIAVDVTSSPKMLSALEAFDVPLVKASFGNSGLVGIYMSLNSNGAIIPSFCDKAEIALLRSHGL